MKVTLSAAMRARDVSRPHAEHEALASAGEAETGAGREKGSPASLARLAERSAAAGDAGREAANNASANNASANNASANNASANSASANSAGAEGAAARGAQKSRRPHRRHRRR
jgi:hypothetical protein